LNGEHQGEQVGYRLSAVGSPTEMKLLRSSGFKGRDPIEGNLLKRSELEVFKGTVVEAMCCLGEANVSPS
jgi:hypothetical protein